MCDGDGNGGKEEMGRERREKERKERKERERRVVKEGKGWRVADEEGRGKSGRGGVWLYNVMGWNRRTFKIRESGCMQVLEWGALGSSGMEICFPACVLEKCVESDEEGSNMRLSRFNQMYLLMANVIPLYSLTQIPLLFYLYVIIPSTPLLPFIKPI